MKLKPWLHLGTGFAVFNVAIGITLYFFYPKTPLTIVSPLVPQPFWATIFLFSGLIMVDCIIRRKLATLWYMMIFGLFIKAMWEVGLLLRAVNGGTLFTAEIWGLIFYIQFLGVVYFNRKVLV